MFRDDDDAARARADALEVQNRELQRELAAKDERIRELLAQLTARDQPPKPKSIPWIFRGDSFEIGIRLAAFIIIAFALAMIASSW